MILRPPDGPITATRPSTCEWGDPDADGFRVCLTRRALQRDVQTWSVEANRLGLPDARARAVNCYHAALRALSQHHCGPIPRPEQLTLAGFGALLDVVCHAHYRMKTTQDEDAKRYYLSAVTAITDAVKPLLQQHTGE